MKKKLFLLALSLFLLSGAMACTEAEQNQNEVNQDPAKVEPGDQPDGNVNVLPPGVKPEDVGPSTESEDPLLNL